MRLLPRQRRRTVPVPSEAVRELRSAVAEWEQAPASARGECRDEIVAAAVALLHETPEEAGR